MKKRSQEFNHVLTTIISLRNIARGGRKSLCWEDGVVSKSYFDISTFSCEIFFSTNEFLASNKQMSGALNITIIRRNQ